MDVHITAIASEPGGWRAARVFLGGSLAFTALYAYFEILHTSGSVSMLVLGAAAGLSGVAELLSKNRRRSAAVLRLMAIGLLVVLIAAALRSLQS